MLDWAGKPLGKVATLQRGFDLPHRMRRAGTVPIVTSSGTEETHSDAMVKAPGVVTGRYGTIGQVFFVREDFWPLNTTLYVRDFHGNDPMFVSYLLRTIDFHTHSGKSGVPGVNRNDLHQIEVRIPQSKSEQETIAGALSDADALIESLEELLAKKRHLKQGAMQELLTGKTRLPGFRNAWVTTTFENAVARRTVRVQPSVARSRDFCVELEHVGAGTGALIGSTLTDEHSSLKSVFQVGDVLFGKLRAYLRKYWLADRSGVCSTEFWVLSPKGPLLSRSLLFFLVQTEAFVTAASSSYGTHMPRSDWNVAKAFTFAVPKDVVEQEAIAQALTDIDTEIAALEAKLTKARQIKQGMMQELLTGRIRLV